jgi:hypothetical protein
MGTIGKIIVGLLSLICFCHSFADVDLSKGKKLYEARCAMCHGTDGRATGILAKASNPPTPDLTSCDYQKKLAQSPGRMVASIVLTPGGNLIPDTLARNNIVLPHHTWTDKELRGINEYLLNLIAKQPHCVDPSKFRMHV